MEKMTASLLEAAERLKFLPLKNEQMSSIIEFLKGNDVFVMLSIGLGKTVCYSCIPLAFVIYNNKPAEENPIILVISSLTTLIKHQVTNLLQCGVATGYVDSNSLKGVKDEVNKGHYNILFMSPELLMIKWRSLLGSSIYQSCLVGVIIDEAHCVVKW